MDRSCRSCLNDLSCLKEKMDEEVAARALNDMIGDEAWMGMRAIRIINWIPLLFALIAFIFLFYWLFTSAKSTGSGKGRVTWAGLFPWTENDTTVSVSTSVKPIHLVEYVNSTGSGSVTAFIDNPWTENDTDFAAPNVKTAVKHIHVSEYVKQTQPMMGNEKGRVTAFIDNPWTENDTTLSISTAVKPIHQIEYANNTGSEKLMGCGKRRVIASIDNSWTENDTNCAVPNVKTVVKPIDVIESVNQTQLMIGSGKGRVTGFIDNPWTENDTIVSVSTAAKPIHLIDHANNTASGAAHE
ncbi:hypothetical protein FXO37_01225 [Capsicum annuum]|nr:hypothetical protein FXO37_01225 [Capsicum annuum]